MHRLVTMVAVIALLLTCATQAQATHFYSTKAEQALEALITTNSLCCSITQLRAHNGTLIGTLPTTDGTAGQFLQTNGAGVWTFATVTGGVTSLTGTANQITVSAPTGAVTLSIPLIFIAPGTIAAATTVTGTQLISTVATGTAPFTVASTTNVANLNASSLNGATFAAPGPIGGGTPAAGSFTTLTAGSGALAVDATGVITAIGSSISRTGNFNVVASGKFGFGAAGAVRWQINDSPAGEFTPTANNSFDIGTAALQARSIYAGTSVITPAVTSTGLALASLAPTTNGTILYCTDCLKGSTPCTGSSTGSMAKRENGAWNCD